LTDYKQNIGFSWFKDRFGSPGFFRRISIIRKSRKSGAGLSHDDINELFRDIDTHSNYLQLIIKAKNSNIAKPENVVSDFYKASKSNNDFINSLIKPLIKAKKNDLDISAENLIKLYGDKKAIPKIVDGLILAAKNDLTLKIDDIKTIFYDKKKFGDKVIELYIKSKREYPKLSPTKFRSLIHANIDLNEFLKVAQLLNSKNLYIPFPILSELLSKRINIIKTIIILSKAKESCISELQKHQLFSDKDTDRLSNIYIVEGKQKFKKALSKSLLYEQLPVDPVNLYYDLTRSEGKGFKVNLETIDEYLGYEYEADINKVTASYLKARKNNLHIKYEQIAVLAQKKVDVEKFIDAQIKSRADE
jgi:hypothetical protein